MEKRITQSSSGTEVKENIADAYTPIFIYEVGAGEELQLKEQGDDKTKLLAKLYDENGDQIDPDSDLVVAVLPPDLEIPEQLAMTPYNIYHELGLGEQGKKENEDFTKLNLRKQGEVKDGDKIVVELKSPDVVDWDQGSELILKVKKL